MESRNTVARYIETVEKVNGYSLRHCIVRTVGEDYRERKWCLFLHPFFSKNSFLYEFAGETGKVNSAHHQAINKIAPGFRISAVSEDGVIEAIEREQEEDHPFIQLVQWHPERMDLKNPLSGNLRTRFLDTL